jgi:hypothetical protein
MNHQSLIILKKALWTLFLRTPISNTFLDSAADNKLYLAVGWRLKQTAADYPWTQAAESLFFWHRVFISDSDNGRSTVHFQKAVR